MQLKARGQKNSIPIYYQLKTLILSEIENGRWEPGSVIPTERFLAEQHHVSVGTVKRAILELVNEGFLYRIQGKGTFVAGTVLRRQHLRYYLLQRYLGDEEAGLKITLIERSLQDAYQPVSDLLRVKKNQKLCRIKRVFTWNETPLVFTISYFPTHLLKGMMELPTSFFENGTLYEAIERTYGLPTIFNQELFGVRTVSGEAAIALHVPEGTSAQYIEMLSFTYKERPYEFRKTYCLTNERMIFRET